MAPLQPALVETDFGLVASEVLRRERKRALVVLFTALEPGALAEGLLPVLPRLAARHRVVVAAVHDPALDALAHDAARHRAPTSTGPPPRTARWPSGTGSAAALTRYGVDVVDAPVDAVRVPGRRRVPGAEAHRPALTGAVRVRRRPGRRRRRRRWHRSCAAAAPGTNT